MAAAAAVQLHRRLLRQSNSRHFFSRFCLVDDGRSQSIDDISTHAQPASRRKSLALHVRRCVNEIWKDITAATTQVSDVRHDHDMAYICQQSRGMLRMPQKEFTRFYALIAYRQLQRCSAMLPADWFGASTCSFRQASTAMAATAASRHQRADKSPSEFSSPASFPSNAVPASIGAPVLRFACTSKEACLSSQRSKSGLAYGDTVDNDISSDEWIHDCEVELQEMCNAIAEELEEGSFIHDDDSDSSGEDDSESGAVGGIPGFCIADEDPPAAYDAAWP